MAPLTFNAIANLHDELFVPWLDLYETAFPPEERLLASAFWKVLAAKEQGKPLTVELLAALDAGQRLVGMAFSELYPEARLAALWYVAVDPRQRSQGLGSQVYQEIVRRVREAGCRAMLFEVEIPENAPAPEAKTLAERRIAFYRRNGARLLTGIHYLQSVGPHQPLTPMHLMIHPLEPLDPPAALALAQGLFGDLVTPIGPLGIE